jgi:hypothetical protein
VLAVSRKSPKLAPYGAAWNPGADAASTIAFDGDVELEGQAVSTTVVPIWLRAR